MVEPGIRTSTSRVPTTDYYLYIMFMTGNFGYAIIALNRGLWSKRSRDASCDSSRGTFSTDHDPLRGAFKV